MALNVIQYGFGYIGQRAVGLMLRKGFNVVAAIDTKPDYLGKDVGEIIGLGKSTGIKITDDVLGVLKKVKADAVCNATVTKLEPLYGQIKPFIDGGINVVSISEELAYPWFTHPELAKKIDESAKAHKVTVVGTGVNPGLDMDMLPIHFSGACFKVGKVKIQRVVDFSVFSPTRGKRRFGINPEEFRKGVIEGSIPLHTGLLESMTMISDALGWKLENISDTWETVVSRGPRKTSMYTVDPGTTAGWKQTAIGSIKGEAKIILETYCLISPTLEEDGVEPGNTTWIDGEPNLVLITKGSTQRGELCTTARLVNIIPVVVEAKPGLISVASLPAAPPRPDVVG